VARPRTPLLDRRRIGAAALRIVDEQGVLTIPALARELGVAPSALYHHVSGRGEIISLMREALALETAPDDWDATQPWEQALEAWARNYRAAFATHAGAVPLLATAPPAAEPFMHAMYEKVAELLLAAGFDTGQVMALINAMESFILGSALDLVAPPVMVSDVPRETAPHLAAVLDQTPTDHRRAELAFDTGLRALLTGFRALLPR
jgi:AcrR family transcriptional regulator